MEPEGEDNTVDGRANEPNDSSALLAPAAPEASSVPGLFGYMSKQIPLFPPSQFDLGF